LLLLTKLFTLKLSIFQPVFFASACEHLCYFDDHLNFILWQEFSNCSPPLEFGRDVTVTSAAGLQAKYIYHVAVRPYRNEYSVKVRSCLLAGFLQVTIITCIIVMHA